MNISPLPAAKAAPLALLTETSWEVCNKVGGIYTVLSSKARLLHDIYGDRCIFIGPSLGGSRGFAPDAKVAARYEAASKALPEGVNVVWGRWEVPGRPIAALVDWRGLLPRLNDIYGEMWRIYGVDSLHAYGDYDECCAFSVAAAMLIQAVIEHCLPVPGPCVAHWDEWQAAMGLLWLKTYCPQSANVFTTHATSIGRSICGNGKPLYDYMKGYDGDQMARELNMEAKHSVEKAAAREADVFSTVSEVTARECTQLLGRTPVVTPNGFDAPRHQLAGARKATRQQLTRVAEALIGRHLPKDALFVATSGRHEYRNKGLDMMLDALKGVQRPVVAFILVPAWNIGPREDLQRRLNDSTPQNVPLPQPYITHYIGNPEDDEVTVNMRRLGLVNNAGSEVVTIYVPCYLDGADGIINMDYYTVLGAMDLTVFPSYYEPWGYTPHESVALGIPTVTTTLSGFGQWASESGKCAPVTVIERTDGNYPAAVTAIAEAVNQAAQKGPNKDCRALARKATWQEFIPYYLAVYAQAVLAASQRPVINH